MADETWSSADGQRIARWMQQRKNGDVVSDKRQLIWVAKALLDGSGAARQELLALFDMQSNILMLNFAGACAFFSIQPSTSEYYLDATSAGSTAAVPTEWHQLYLVVGVVAMLTPMVGAALVLILAGNLRWRNESSFVDLLLDNWMLTGATAPMIILSASAFGMLLSSTVMQLTGHAWVGWTTAGVWIVAYAVVLRVNMRQNDQTHAAAIELLQNWPKALHDEEDVGGEQENLIGHGRR